MWPAIGRVCCGIYIIFMSLQDGDLGATGVVPNAHRVVHAPAELV